MRKAVLLGCSLTLLAAVVPCFAEGAQGNQVTAVNTDSIFNYRKVDDQTITAGQPSEAQLKSVAADGYRTVINLAPITSRDALKDEKGTVQSLGMNYYYIPVEWTKPTEADFATFERTMEAAGKKRTLVHCQANFRASAFYSLYAMKHLGWSKQRAEEFRSSIWKGSDIPVWEAFIAKMESQIQQK